MTRSVQTAPGSVWGQNMPAALSGLFTRSRRQSAVLKAWRSRAGRIHTLPQISCDLAAALPIHSGEIGLLRAFLSDEIGAILFGREET